MNAIILRAAVRPLALQTGLLTVCFILGAHARASANEHHAALQPGNLLVSRFVYDNNPNTVVAGVTQLPPNCLAPNCVTATDGGSYPYVWNNDLVDATFGVTARIFLDQMTPSGTPLNSLVIGEEGHNRDRRDGRESSVVGSFSSKSEGALNLSVDGSAVSIMGYLAPLNALDVSNSNTPLVVDPTNPDPLTNYRVVATVDRNGKFSFTTTNAYSGDNGRAVILNDHHGANVLYGSGNAGNGDDPQPNGIIIGGGAQIMNAEHKSLLAQNPGLPTPVGSFNITQLGQAPDKIGKDTNFRGLTVFDNVVYYTKGSGSNGVNTVYFIDTSGFDTNGKPLACPNGVGLPSTSATLPTAPISYNASLLQTAGVVPYNMCILKGLPTVLKSKTFHPFGIWFADAKTFYLVDEGDGKNDYDAGTGTYSKAAAQTGAGLQKWVFDSSVGAWKLAYVLNAGLNLGVPYTVAQYPTGMNAKTGLPWSPASDGLRNITGRVNRDGTATIWAITSTVSGNGDQGADPNKLMMITDKLAATTLPAGERFSTVRAARFAEVLRGVSFTPGTNVGEAQDRHFANRN